MKIVRCRSSQEAVDLLHHCLEAGEVILGRHFRDKLSSERLDIEDVWVVLRSGAIYAPAEQDIRSREWKWVVEGYEPGGRWLAVVFAFKAIDRAFLITVYSVEARKR